RRRPRRVHRRHPVPRNPELREEDSRHGRRLSPALRARPGARRRRRRRCDAGQRPEIEVGCGQTGAEEKGVVQAGCCEEENRLMSKLTGSKKIDAFPDSVIREMSRLNDLYDAVNLSQGFPDFPAPEAIKEAAGAAIRADINQYPVSWGAPSLTEAIAAQFARRYGLPVVAEEQVTVCCGSTEAMMATMVAIIDPGDEVIVFEPFYENYIPDSILSGATPRYVTLREPDWTFDPHELAA